MNYIARFLLEYIGDEEESFYLLIGLLQNTDYGDLFMNDFYKLKEFFYIIERLMSIFIPELFTYLKNLGITPNYYLSPWFITLFTNSFQHCYDSKNPKFILFVFDSLILVKL